MIPVTDIPEMQMYSRITATEVVKPRSVFRGLTVKGIENCYYTITEFIPPTLMHDSSYLLSYQSEISVKEKQFNLIGLSKELFKNSKYLGEAELAVMNKTYSRLFSKTPTRLK